MPSPEGRFVWYELMTTDPAAAVTFYGAVVGWQAHDAGMPGMVYQLLHAGAAPPVGGLMAMPPDACDAGVRPGWVGYVGVASVDAQVERVVAAGGRVHKPANDIPGVGRFAVVADPDGAVFSLFKGEPRDGMPAPAPAAPGTPGHIGWHELYGGDPARSLAFYGGLFGWTAGDAIDMGPMGTYQLFAIDGVQAGGMMACPSTAGPPHWQYYINVDRLPDAVARVTANGGQVLHGPQQVPGGSWIAQCLDPQGAFFALVGPG